MSTICGRLNINFPRLYIPRSSVSGLFRSVAQFCFSRLTYPSAFYLTALFKGRFLVFLSINIELLNMFSKTCIYLSYLYYVVSKHESLLHFHSPQKKRKFSTLAFSPIHCVEIVYMWVNYQNMKIQGKTWQCLWVCNPISTHSIQH